MLRGVRAGAAGRGGAAGVGIERQDGPALEVVLKHNPDLAEKLKHGKPTNWALKKDWERQQDQRRGKFI